MPEAPPDLLVEDLEVRAGARALLSVPRLAVPAGQVVAVRGPSGAGKSTMLHVLAGLLRPSAGRVLWGAADLAALPEEGRAALRRHRLGVVFQDALLFDELDGLGNAALGAAFAPRGERSALRARASDWLERLGLAGESRRRAASLSGGERQRVGVARALAGGAPVLLADEPTASLDRVGADRLIEDLLGLGGDRTVIVATHDLRLIERAGRVIALEGGRVVEDGNG